MDLPTYFRRTKTTAADLARATKLSHESVRLWARGAGNPKVENVLKIEAATGGKVTRRDLRPDLFAAKRRVA